MRAWRGSGSTMCTFGPSLSTRETVWCETPASRATSKILATRALGWSAFIALSRPCGRPLACKADTHYPAGYRGSHRPTRSLASRMAS
jgi:hypothetical protein